MNIDRFARQSIVLGEKAQKELSEKRVVVIGCGATGSYISNYMVRIGIRNIVIVDRDFVEESNLHRTLFSKDDINEPKASSLAEKLKEIYGDVNVEYIIDDINPKNIEKIVENSDLIMDGTDNMYTRYLINDVSIKLNIPWIYTGILAKYGMTMPIIPKKSACYRCVFTEPPSPGSLPTCETAGILGTVPPLAAAMAVNEGINILTNENVSYNKISYIDASNNEIKKIEISKN